MRKLIDRRSGGRIAACLAATAMLLIAPVRGEEKRERAPCCYTNPRYSGPCAVQPGEGETCASILAYLNNPNSQGKTYCNNTNVKGGWRQAKCAKSD